MKSSAKEPPKGSAGPFDFGDDRPVHLLARPDERLANQHRLREWLIEILSVNFPGEAEKLADEFLLRHEKALRMPLKKQLSCFVMRPK